ncbi:hypothetical protein [Nostoc sp. NMS8]|uniref:hypothetical protein n=1 Tax=Nostoc sp. NMS8 TaxID=2815392 RepID=UPI0025CD14D6|nr:hypothetical protein [Nostoc sp. NMS8]MBN3963446.1 hypothetical protein [Nostoc sp. NMS8]
MKLESAKIWEYYAADHIRSVYYIADMSGAVLIYEATNLESVQAALTQLPMVQSGVLQTEIRSIATYTRISLKWALDILQ